MAQPASPELRRPPVVLLAMPALAIVAAWTVITGSTGRLETAFGDGWSYLRIAFRFAETGTFALNGYASTAFFGQALVSWPVLELFPNSLVAAQLWGACVAAIGVVAFTFIARDHVGDRSAAFAAVVLVASPIAATLTASYFTDFPALVAQMLCIALGIRALVKESPGALFAAMLAGFIGFTIRDFAITAPIAVIVVVSATHLVRAPRVGKIPAALSVVALGVACALFSYWRRSLPNLEPFPIEISIDRVWQWIPRVAVTLGLLVLPAAVTVPPLALVRALSKWARVVAGVVSVLGIALMVAAATRGVGLIGDLVRQPMSSFIGAGPPRWVWTTLTVAGAYSVTILVLAVVGLIDASNPKRVLRERPDRLVLPLGTLFAVGPLLVYVASSIKLPPYDRYLMPMLPGCIVALLAARALARQFERVRQPSAALVLAPLALAALLIVSAWLLVDTARQWAGVWDGARDVVRRGVPATKVDAPAEWTAFNGPFVTGPGQFGRKWRTKLAEGRCVVVTWRTPKEGWILVDRRRIERLNGTHIDQFTSVQPSSECERTLGVIGPVNRRP